MASPIFSRVMRTVFPPRFLRKRVGTSPGLKRSTCGGWAAAVSFGFGGEGIFLAGGVDVGGGVRGGLGFGDVGVEFFRGGLGWTVDLQPAARRTSDCEDDCTRCHVLFLL